MTQDYDNNWAAPCSLTSPAVSYPCQQLCQIGIWCDSTLIYNSVIPPWSESAPHPYISSPLKVTHPYGHSVRRVAVSEPLRGTPQKQAHVSSTEQQPKEPGPRSKTSVGEHVWHAAMQLVGATCGPDVTHLAPSTLRSLSHWLSGLSRWPGYILAAWTNLTIGHPCIVCVCVRALLCGFLLSAEFVCVCVCFFKSKRVHTANNCETFMDAGMRAYSCMCACVTSNYSVPRCCSASAAFASPGCCS